MTDTSAPDRPAASRELRSLGILGGTFNPPHLGHLAIARSARAELSLGAVVLMPARTPPHKPVAGDPGGDHRLAMCGLLVEGTDRLSACALELERDGPSYTVDSLRAIHASHPELELTFIVGADIASTLPSWREPAELLALADLAVAARSGTDRQAVRAAIAPLGGRSDIRFLAAPVLDVSSSMVRERVARREPIGELVGDAVAAYVEGHDLYRAREQALG